MTSTIPNGRPKVEKSGDVTILTFTGIRTLHVDNIVAYELESRANKSVPCHLLLDFGNVEFITSVELGTLVALHTKMRACGGRLTLFNLSAQVYEVFTVTNLHKLLSICRREPLPLAKLTESSHETGASRSITA